MLSQDPAYRELTAKVRYRLASSSERRIERMTFLEHWDCSGAIDQCQRPASGHPDLYSARHLLPMHVTRRYSAVRG